MIRKILKLQFITYLINWIFTYMSFLIPINRLYETSSLMAFHHPSPSYKFHVLIVPKKQIDSLANLNPSDTDFLTDLYSTVQKLIKQFDLKAYRIIVNGGEYQDFPHLHFHLISD